MKISKKYIHQSGRSKGKLKQAILQVKGRKFRHRDPHPTVPNIYFIDMQNGKQRWGLESSLKPIKNKRYFPQGIAKRWIHQSGCHKGLLNQVALQVEGKFKIGDKHPVARNVFYIEIAYKDKKSMQRWGDKVLLENCREGARREDKRRANNPKVRARRNKQQNRRRAILKKTNPEKLKAINKEQYIKRRANGKEQEARAKPEYKRRARISHKKAYRVRVANGKQAEWRSRPQVRIRGSLRARVKKFLKGAQSETTMELVGADLETVLQHIKSQFYDNPQTGEPMTMDNYGQYGWHIDHIIPCASFNLLDPKEQKICFNYTNLQPLWWFDNLEKGDKLNWKK